MGVGRKPLVGVIGVWRRSWVSREPVARPQAWGRSSAAERWVAAAKPTPASSEDVRTTLRPLVRAWSMMERATKIPPTLASFSTRRSTELESTRAWARCGFSTDSSAAMGIGEVLRIRKRVSGSAGVTGSSMNSGSTWRGVGERGRPGARARPGWRRGGA